MASTVDSDHVLAMLLQEEEQMAYERRSAETSGQPKNAQGQTGQPTMSLVDEAYELIDPTPDIYQLFCDFNKHFFWGKLGGVELKWSPRMTRCAGVCSYQPRAGLCSVRLSKPLLTLRPRRDLVETLLHEMIHALLFVTHNIDNREEHGPEFHRHMRRINKIAGTNITVYHTFHDEVRHMLTHWWRCTGSCRSRRPYFGFVKRSMNRAPGPNDFWWRDHVTSCGGTFEKIREPEGFKNGKKGSKAAASSGSSKLQDIRNFMDPTKAEQPGKGGDGKKRPGSSTAETGNGRKRPGSSATGTGKGKKRPDSSAAGAVGPARPPAAGGGPPPRPPTQGSTKTTGDGRFPEKAVGGPREAPPARPGAGAGSAGTARPSLGTVHNPGGRGVSSVHNNVHGFQKPGRPSPLRPGPSRAAVTRSAAPRRCRGTGATRRPPTPGRRRRRGTLGSSRARRQAPGGPPRHRPGTGRTRRASAVSRTSSRAPSAAAAWRSAASTSTWTGAWPPRSRPPAPRPRRSTCLSGTATATISCWPMPWTSLSRPWSHPAWRRPRRRTPARSRVVRSRATPRAAVERRRAARHAHRPATPARRTTTCWTARW